MGGERGRDSRGRVVMLVDNAVNGDSRVQKAARSAADAGWEVILLGRSPDGEPHTWRLGAALVRLLPMGGGGARGGAVRAAAAAGGAAATGVARGARKSLVRRGMAALPAPVRRLRRPAERAVVWYWLRRMGDRAWRRLEPGLWDYEAAYGPVIDELAPDLIHANDFRMLGVGARATDRARTAGRDVKLVWDAHEFLPGIKPWRNTVRWLPAHCAYEREYSGCAHAVVTVSDELAELLRREHKLPKLPTVVLNAPDVAIDADCASGQPGGGGIANGQPASGVPDGTPSRDQEPASALPTEGLRARCGVGPDVPLLVYSGAAMPQRGLALMVEALPELAAAHVAFVINKPDGAFAKKLRARAVELGVADRLHVLGYVPHDQVVGLLSGADVGVIPIQHWPNHEIALITKFFEYSHARLPIVVSDVRTMSAVVQRTGQGEVFRAEEVTDYVRAVRAVLADPGRYRAAYDQPGLLAAWTWQAQARVLDGVYANLLAGQPETLGVSAG